jgi:hypothetical protein
MTRQQQAQTIREKAAYYFARYELEGKRNPSDLGRANALNAEAERLSPRDPRQADEAAAFSLTHPTPPAAKDTTRPLF